MGKRGWAEDRGKGEDGDWSIFDLRTDFKTKDRNNSG
jgi:hypothetical protein